MAVQSTASGLLCRCRILDHLYIYAGNVAVLRYVPMFRVLVSALSTKVYCHFVQTLRLVLKYVVCHFVQLCA